MLFVCESRGVMEMEVITKRTRLKVSEYIASRSAPSNFFLNVVSAVMQSLSILVSSVV